MVKVWLNNGYEVQVDLGTGPSAGGVSAFGSDRVDSRRFFFRGDWTKLGLFLPTGVTLLLLWLGGVWMFWVPFWAKRKRRSRRSWPRRVLGCLRRDPEVLP